MLVNIEPTLITEFLSNPVCVRDMRGAYTHCNDAFLRVANKKIADVIGRRDHDIHPPEIAHAHTETDLQLLESKYKWIEYEINHPNARYSSFKTRVHKLLITSHTGENRGFILFFKPDDNHFYECIKNQFNLTSRELSVFILLNGGLAVKAIARDLGISSHTVGDHMKSIYVKMGIKSRSELQAKIGKLG